MDHFLSFPRFIYTLHKDKVEHSDSELRVPISTKRHTKVLIFKSLEWNLLDEMGVLASALVDTASP